MNPDFIVDRQGKKFVLYAGLLDQAHQEGLKSIRTRLVQIPNETNQQTAIVTAEIETEKGIFCGIGDANPTNVSRMIAPHLIRMAETRAKARALRDAVNVGMVAVEELGEDDDNHVPARPTGNGHVPQKAIPPTTKAPTPPAPRPAPAVASKVVELDLGQPQAPSRTETPYQAQLRRIQTAPAYQALREEYDRAKVGKWTPTESKALLAAATARKEALAMEQAQQEYEANGGLGSEPVVSTSLTTLIVAGPPPN